MKVNTKTLFAKAAKIALVAALASSLALVGCKSDDDDDDDPVLTSVVAGGSFTTEFKKGGTFDTNGVSVYAVYDNTTGGYSDVINKSKSKTEVTDKATYTVEGTSTVLKVGEAITLEDGMYKITVTYEGKTASEKLSLTVKSTDSGNTGNTGDNTGNTGNTGDNTGNTGDNSGNTGNTGDNTGNTGNTGDNTGNTGNNSGTGDATYDTDENKNRLFKQDFESVTEDSVKSLVEAEVNATVALGTDKTNYFKATQNGSGARFASMPITTADNGYVLSFDLLLKGGNALKCSGNQQAQFMLGDGKIEANTINESYIFSLFNEQVAQAGEFNTTWYVGHSADGKAITLETDKTYQFTITVAKDGSVKATIANDGTTVLDEAITKTAATSKISHINMVCGRSGGEYDLDNIVVKPIE